MEILILTKDFKPCHIIDSFENFSWGRKYYDPGSFSLEILLNDYWEIINNNGVFVYCSEFEDTGKIETVEYNSSEAGTTVIITGRFLESVLGDRVIPATASYSGYPAQIALDLIIDYCIECDNPLFDGKLSVSSYLEVGEKITYQTTGEDIKTAIYNLLKPYELSVQILYDYEEDTLTARVWQGKDRTENQKENSWATFSKNFENIQDDKYSKDETQFKNYAYVAGEGSSGSRVVVEINKVANNEERKELYVDARDLQQDEDMSDDEYKSILYQRGLEKLKENNKVEIAEFEVDPNSNLTYGKDYDLGDIITYKSDDLGFYIENRIVEINVVIDEGVKTIQMTLGDDYNVRKVVR